MILTFAKSSKRFDLLFGFPVPVWRRLDPERSYLAEWRRCGSRRSLCLLADLQDLDLLLSVFAFY